MIPRLIEFGPIPVNSFGLCIALAAFGASILLAKSFERYEIDPKLSERYVLWGIVSGLVGARLWSLIHRWEDTLRDPIGEIFSSAGFIFYGGFILATAVLITLSKIDKIPFSKFLDALAPTLAFGYGVGRLGCQLSGDGDYGIPTESVFGMAYPGGVVPTPPGVLVYPTPLYESTMAFMICGVLLMMERKRVAPYSVFAWYLVLISIERFLIEFLRINPKLYGSLSEAQVISIGLVFIGLALYSFSRKRASIVGSG